MKDLLNDRNWELITRYLGNEMDDTEKKEFNAWLNESPDNRKELEHAEKMWQLSSQKEAGLFTADSGWDKLQHRIASTHETPSISRKSVFLSIARIAATLLVLIATTYTVTFFINKSNFVTITANAQIIEHPVVLPDGTKVLLNTGAKITYPKKFGVSARTIELSGEAFFDVTRNEKIPFIIKTQCAQIKVLGTSFNVYARENSDSVQVAVSTGIVELSPRDVSKKLLIKKGKTGVYLEENKNLALTASDINTTAWFTKKIIFDQAGLVYVAKTLEKLFNKKIQIDNENIKNCKLNADYKNVDLNEILEAMKVSLKLEIIKKPDGYLITGPGC